MILRTAALVTGLCLACSGWLHAREPSDVDALRSRVREWLTLRDELARARVDWKREDELLQAEQDLLARRKQELQHQIEATGQQKDAAEAETAKVSAECAAVEDDVTLLRNAVAKAEDHLRACRLRLPTLLRDQLAGGFASLASASAPEDTRALAERLQVVTALYAELQRLARGAHIGKLLIADADGNEREMDVLFLGLTVGYAVSADNTRAASGRVAPEGWSWTWDANLAPVVRASLTRAHSDGPPDLVTLPVRVREAGK